MIKQKGKIYKNDKRGDRTFMEEKEIITHVDHTQLKPFATWEDIEKLHSFAATFSLV